MKNGRVAYCGSIRHKHALLCPHGALGRMFTERFTLRGERFPSPLNFQEWINRVLFKGQHVDKSLSYSQQLTQVHSWFNKLGIISSKKTHAFRVAASRLMEDCGVDEQVCGSITCQ
jgi:Centromere DNA-binding protein complex CBF3 subunit, domain 2